MQRLKEFKGRCESVRAGARCVRAGGEGFCVHTTFDCKKLKQLQLHNVVLRCPHHL